MLIVYYSGVSEFTHRFVEKLEQVQTYRIPIKATGDEPAITEDYILITPTYATNKRLVPPQVIKFLNNETNRKHIKGVIGSGNTNFNSFYCAAARAVSNKCNVPHLYNFELLGTVDDVKNVKTILDKFEE